MAQSFLEGSSGAVRLAGDKMMTDKIVTIPLEEYEETQRVLEDLRTEIDMIKHKKIFNVHLMVNFYGNYQYGKLINNDYYSWGKAEKTTTYTIEASSDHFKIPSTLRSKVIDDSFRVFSEVVHKLKVDADSHYEDFAEKKEKVLAKETGVVKAVRDYKLFGISTLLNVALISYILLF